MNEVVEGLRTTIELGGPVVVILLILSLIAATVVVYKLIIFARWRLDDDKGLARGIDAWIAGDRDGALDRLARLGTPGSRVVAAAIRGIECADGARHEALVREEVQRLGAAAVEDARSHLRILEVIGALAPLLGLLGTVIGMIDAFRALEEAGSRVDPSVLSGGIWVALMTTAVGLAVAIPVVAASVWLERRVERYRHRLQNAVTRVFTSTMPQSSIESSSRYEPPIGAPMRRARETGKSGTAAPATAYRLDVDEARHSIDEETTVIPSAFGARAR
ncbi:MAG: MotA/TolQ/ExbB proton channel family protein [Thioalkalivibrionaceae bacterium]